MDLTSGLNFKLTHFDDAICASESGLWFEVHAENYMVGGGARLAALNALRDRHPISLHGVGLSLASVDLPDAAHLKRFCELVDWVEPCLISDHLAWQRWGGVHHSDFLPFPRTSAALDCVSRNVMHVQEAFGRQILIENPSLYVDLPGHEMSEAEFMSALASRSGCGLLVDVNNIYVSATNLGYDPGAAVDAFPANIIGEIHLAGHARDEAEDSALLIDTHGAAISDDVWALFKRLIDRVGPRPTLIERDDDIPAFAVLMEERATAHRHLRAAELVNG